MEQRQQRLNSGIIFKNDRKQSPTHADYNGEINVNGDAYFINLWVKTGKTGKPFFSVGLKPKGQQGNRDYSHNQVPSNDPDLPF